MDWDKVKLGSWSAIGGAIVLAFVGFNYGGWVTGGAAAATAKETAADAVAERLGTICVAQFNRDSEKGEKLKEMKGKESWDRGRYIEKQSWAIMPGDDKPDSRVADACAKQFAQTANATTTMRCMDNEPRSGEIRNDWPQRARFAKPLLASPRNSAVYQIEPARPPRRGRWPHQ